MGYVDKEWMAGTIRECLKISCEQGPHWNGEEGHKEFLEKSFP